MSMWLSFVRVSPETFKQIEASPTLLEAVWFGEGKQAEAECAKLGIDPDTHTAGLDYLSLNQAFEMMAEDTGEESDDDAVIGDLEPTGTVAYEAGYDEAFYLDPKAVNRLLAGSSVLEADKDVKALFAAAATAGEYVFGVIS
jgi:hypothetical protein